MNFVALTLRQFPTDALDRRWLDERMKAWSCAKFWVRKCRDATSVEERERCEKWLGIAAFEHRHYNNLIWNRIREIENEH